MSKEDQLTNINQSNHKQRTKFWKVKYNISLVVCRPYIHIDMVVGLLKLILIGPKGQYSISHITFSEHIEVVYVTSL